MRVIFAMAALPMRRDLPLRRLSDYRVSIADVFKAAGPGDPIGAAVDWIMRPRVLTIRRR